MTVSELIEILNKVENKNLQVLHEDNEFGVDYVNEIILRAPHAWDNPNDALNNFYVIQ